MASTAPRAGVERHVGRRTDAICSARHGHKQQRCGQQGQPVLLSARRRSGLSSRWPRAGTLSAATDGQCRLCAFFAHFTSPASSSPPDSQCRRIHALNRHRERLSSWPRRFRIPSTSASDASFRTRHPPRLLSLLHDDADYECTATGAHPNRASCSVRSISFRCRALGLCGAEAHAPQTRRHGARQWWRCAPRRRRDAAPRRGGGGARQAETQTTTHRRLGACVWMGQVPPGQPCAASIGNVCCTRHARGRGSPLKTPQNVPPSPGAGPESCLFTALALHRPSLCPLDLLLFTHFTAHSSTRPTPLSPTSTRVLSASCSLVIIHSPMLSSRCVNHVSLHAL